MVQGDLEECLNLKASPAVTQPGTYMPWPPVWSQMTHVLNFRVSDTTFAHKLNASIRRAAAASVKAQRFAVNRLADP